MGMGSSEDEGQTRAGRLLNIVGSDMLLSMLFLIFGGGEGPGFGRLFVLFFTWGLLGTEVFGMEFVFFLLWEDWGAGDETACPFLFGPGLSGEAFVEPGLVFFLLESSLTAFFAILYAFARPYTGRNRTGSEVAARYLIRGEKTYGSSKLKEQNRCLSGQLLWLSSWQYCMVADLEEFHFRPCASTHRGISDTEI